MSLQYDRSSAQPDPAPAKTDGAVEHARPDLSHDAAVPAPVTIIHDDHPVVDHPKTRPVLDSPEPKPTSVPASTDEEQKDIPAPPPPSPTSAGEPGEAKYNKPAVPTEVVDAEEKEALDEHNEKQIAKGDYTVQFGDTKLHLFLPATSPNEHLCKTLFTAAAMGYPTPRLVNWGLAPEPGLETVSHLKKIRGIGNALTALGIDAVNDLVLITDAYDLWFNLPAEAMVERYHEIIRAEDERTKRLYGQGALDAGMRAYSVFAPDKGCFGNKREDYWCYMQAESSLPTDLYGNRTDVEDGGWFAYSSYRPRYLNSGVIMGPAGKLLETFWRAEDFMTTIGIDAEHDFWQSDQRVLSMVYVEQQLDRMHRGRENPQWKDKSDPPAENRTSPYTNPEYTPNLDIHPNMMDIEFTPLNHEEGEWNLGHEHGITIDFTERLSQTTNAADKEWAYLQYTNGGYPQDVPPLGDARDCRLHVQNGLPADLIDRPVPHADLLGDNITTEAMKWSDVRLYTNLCTGEVPGIIHHNGDKSMREKQWPSLWYTSAGFRIMASLRKYATEHPNEHVNTGNAITDKGVPMTWGQTCGMEAKHIFQEQLEEMAPGTTSFGVPSRFYKPRRGRRRS